MQHLGIEVVQTPYINTISPEQEPVFPGDEEMEKRIRRIVRWNAMAMVTRANHRYPGIGGHLSTYASAAALYEVGFNHFFRGKADGGGDQIFFQGHAAPGIYARAFLEGRLGEAHLDAFRRETTGHGLPSYPHPRSMPDFWEFPTVSMGLGPLNAIYQARFNRYLHNRGLKDTSGSRVWAFLGDGETDEPEALGALHVAANEGLDNLIFVVNCNLQRLDGPVRGNGKIIQELEAVFRGSGWNVIKVILGREWDDLLARDDRTACCSSASTPSSTAGGSATTSRAAPSCASTSSAPTRASRSWSSTSRTSTSGTSSSAATTTARCTPPTSSPPRPTGRPTALLVKTVKGWALGKDFEGRYTTHQLKKLNTAQLRAFRDVLHLPIPDDDLVEESRPTTTPGWTARRSSTCWRAGARSAARVPQRQDAGERADAPGRGRLRRVLPGDAGEARGVHHDGVRAAAPQAPAPNRSSGPRIVPIIPDEARTFGMESLFKDLGIYAAEGPALRAGRPQHDPPLPGGAGTGRSSRRGSRRPGRWRRSPRPGPPTRPTA